MEGEGEGGSGVGEKEGVWDLSCGVERAVN